ncbi:MAG TPA: serine hydrolase [Tepidisphaeraceae bacterium]|jgi:CubicO group peptidase (beta-lactamase class C family)
MSKSWRYLVVLLLTASAAKAATTQPADWPTAAPESQGFDPDKLDAFKTSLAARGSTSILVLRHDKVVCEWYAPNYSRYTPHGTASLAKALVGGTSLLLAIDAGRISADDLASKYIPAWKSDPVRSQITIRQLATHTSGIEDAEEGETPHDQLTGWKGNFWKRQPDPYSIALHDAPVIFKPGSANAYSNPGMAALAYAIASSLRGAPQTDLHELLRERIMDPMGIAAKEWSLGYGKPTEMDGLKLYATWGGANYSPRAAAAVGRLLMHKGDWNGVSLIKPQSVEKSLAYAGMPVPRRSAGNPAPGSGLGWYTNFDHVWPNIPPDAFAGAGAAHQTLLVVPSLDLIIVRFGSSLTAKGDDLSFWAARQKYIIEPLMDALIDRPKPPPTKSQTKAQAPFPQSPIIHSITWAPIETIQRKALGSDCWPLTWADDDSMYTAYGDGNGFEPQLPDKLSLGIARVDGPANAFRGINIRSPIEQMGNGPAGKKASGIVMVNGTLYLLVRNANNAQLASSTDHGKSWHWADWKFDTSFGCPTFLNYGRDYAGARDKYLYIYSPDTVTAYKLADGAVLARVPADHAMQREAYEFFAKRDSNSQAVWTKDIAHRGLAFQNKSATGRITITYDAPIKRYLLWQGGQTDGRFKGGFTIYDAPEPWGPWTTVYSTQTWDAGPGESGSFPTKWISSDGLTVHLVFSGNDSFSVRKATLSLAK